MNKMHIEGVRPPPPDVIQASMSHVAVAQSQHPMIPTPVTRLQGQVGYYFPFRSPVTNLAPSMYCFVFF